MDRVYLPLLGQPFLGILRQRIQTGFQRSDLSTQRSSLNSAREPGSTGCKLPDSPQNHRQERCSRDDLARKRRRSNQGQIQRPHHRSQGQRNERHEIPSRRRREPSALVKPSTTRPPIVPTPWRWPPSVDPKRM
jgi:hypothetical protein